MSYNVLNNKIFILHKLFYENITIIEMSRLVGLRTDDEEKCFWRDCKYERGHSKSSYHCGNPSPQRQNKEHRSEGRDRGLHQVQNVWFRPEKERWRNGQDLSWSWQKEQASSHHQARDREHVRSSWSLLGEEEKAKQTKKVKIKLGNKKTLHNPPKSTKFYLLTKAILLKIIKINLRRC